jgi:hypothetical protein
VGRIEGAERQALLCKGFACLSLAASKSSSIELASRHQRPEMPMGWRENVAPPCEKGARLRRLLLVCAVYREIDLPVCPCGAAEAMAIMPAARADARR